jgi:zinc transport system ATP-binding protein
MRGPSITCTNVELSLSGVQILYNIDLRIEAGAIHCIVGPNGGGKTSFVRCLLGQMPHTGTIQVSAARGEPTTAYVPQFLDFDKTLPVTVDDFFSLVIHRHRPAFVGLGKSGRRVAEAALERVGLKGKRRTKLGSLSGGERQRVLFAQALIPEPDLLVLDEPMTSMDEVGAEVFVKLIRELAADGVTIIWIAHDLGQVSRLADAVTCINKTVLFSGPPSEVLAAGSAEELFGHVVREAAQAEIAP